MLRIQSIEIDDFNSVIGYRLNNGEIISADSAFDMVREGKIESAILGVNEKGERTIYVIPEAINFNKDDKLIIEWD